MSRHLAILNQKSLKAKGQASNNIRTVATKLRYLLAGFEYLQ